MYIYIHIKYIYVISIYVYRKHRHILNLGLIFSVYDYYLYKMILPKKPLFLKQHIQTIPNKQRQPSLSPLLWDILLWAIAICHQAICWCLASPQAPMFLASLTCDSPKEFRTKKAAAISASSVPFQFFVGKSRTSYIHLFQPANSRLWRATWKMKYEDCANHFPCFLPDAFAWNHSVC